MIGAFASGAMMVKRRSLPELLLQTQITVPGQTVEHGTIVTASAVAWNAIYREIKANPDAIFEFARNPRQFEEFLAATYDRDGWDEVTLTPRSNDGGRDVIAVKRGFCTVRILDQAKAYSPNHLVTHDDVRAMLGVLQLDSNSSKGVITTTSDFQPTIRSNSEIQRFLPYRLELKSGRDLLSWLDHASSS
jgi:restriction system protein